MPGLLSHFALSVDDLDQRKEMLQVLAPCLACQLLRCRRHCTTCLYYIIMYVLSDPINQRLLFQLTSTV